MSIYNGLKFCDSGKIIIIDDKGRFPSGPEIAKWLFRLNEKDFVEALVEMVNSGFMKGDKGEKTLNAYIEGRRPYERQ